MLERFSPRVKEAIYASLDRIATHRPARKLMLMTHQAVGSALGAGNHDDDGFRTGENRVIGAIGMLHADPVLLDIGANNGSWTLEACARIPRARVIAIEPGAHALATLTSRVGQDRRVAILPVAIGEMDGTAELFGTDNGLQASLKRDVLRRTTRVGQEEIPSETANVVTWPSLVRMLNASGVDLDRSPITAVKLDVEGLELDVLRQLAAWSGFSNIELIQFEFHMHALAQGQLIEDFHQLLGSDFELFRLSKHALIHRSELAEADENHYGFSNWVAIRQERAADYAQAFAASSGRRLRPYEWRR